MRNTITVSQLNAYIKRMFGKDENLSDVLIRGEISNFKKHHSGHMYFTLKDSKAVLNCIMFASNGFRLNFRPENGMQVSAAGYVSIYEKSGQYQLYVSNMMAEGEGALYARFELLKKELEQEGLFDEVHKKKLPFLPSSIGVVTSSTGSVIRDIINVIDRRFPGFNLLMYPSNVQGKGAEIEIAAGIDYFNKVKPVEIIIIARGGGSIEDLWPFNEEILARAIYASDIPVVSAVGHETDFTIADFVADLRAPTPSAAAELVVPELKSVINKLNVIGDRMKNAMDNMILIRREKLELIISRPVMKRPGEIFDMAALSLDRTAEKIGKAVKAVIEKKDVWFRECSSKLEILSPLGTLTRGYSILSDNLGHVITSISQVEMGGKIQVVIKDGTIRGTVEGKEDENGKKII